MIGLGTWEIPVNSMFYKGCAEITVKNDGGNYDFEFFLPGFKVPKMDIFNGLREKINKKSCIYDVYVSNNIKQYVCDCKSKSNICLRSN